MEKVDAQAVNRGPELRKRVEPSLEASHVVAIAPIVDERTCFCQLHALRPVAHGLLLGPTRHCQTPPEILNRVRRNRDAESTHCFIGRWQIDAGWRHDRCLRACLR